MLRPASTPVTRLGLQIPNFTYPGVPDAGLFERVSEIAADGGALRVRLGLGDGPPLPDRRDGAADERDARGLHPARCARRAHVERPPRHARHAASRTAIRRCSRRSRPRSTSSRRGARSSASARPGTSRSTGATASSSSRRASASSGSPRPCRSAVCMFREDTPSFDGTYYRIENALNIPRPVTPGGPPILIGGSGEKWTLRLVAERGDACNLFGDLETIRHKLSVLEAHCDEIGRDSSEITKTRLGGLLIGETDAKAQAKLAPLRGESRGHGGAGEGLRARRRSGCRRRAGAGVSRRRSRRAHLQHAGRARSRAGRARRQDARAPVATVGRRSSGPLE